MPVAPKPIEQLKATAQMRVIEFSSRYDEALESAPEPWAEQYGEVHTTEALEVDWEIDLTPVGYRRVEGDNRKRTGVYEVIKLRQGKFEDGAYESFEKAGQDRFNRWERRPGQMARAARILPNEVIAALLANGENIKCWDGVNFFAANHPYNKKKKSLGEFSNLHTNMPLTLDNYKASRQRFREIKGADGRSKGMRMTHLWVPPELEDNALDIVERRILVENGAGVDNRHYGKVKVVVADELPANAWYSLALNKEDVPPWVWLSMGAPDNRVLGLQSALFERTGQVGFESYIMGEGGLLFPQAIQKHVTS